MSSTRSLPCLSSEKAVFQGLGPPPGPGPESTTGPGSTAGPGPTAGPTAGPGSMGLGRRACVPERARHSHMQQVYRWVQKMQHKSSHSLHIRHPSLVSQSIQWVIRDVNFSKRCVIIFFAVLPRFKQRAQQPSRRYSLYLAIFIALAKLKAFWVLVAQQPFGDAPSIVELWVTRVRLVKTFGEGNQRFQRNCS